MEKLNIGYSMALEVFAKLNGLGEHKNGEKQNWNIYH
ncbi:MAG: hypothetical protein ACI9T7_000185 [Oleiphilaceae bacterium]|jgi:hypothetical protein